MSQLYHEMDGPFELYPSFTDDTFSFFPAQES